MEILRNIPLQQNQTYDFLLEIDVIIYSGKWCSKVISSLFYGREKILWRVFFFLDTLKGRIVQRSVEENSFNHSVLSIVILFWDLRGNVKEHFLLFLIVYAFNSLFYHNMQLQLFSLHSYSNCSSKIEALQISRCFLKYAMLLICV